MSENKQSPEKNTKESSKGNNNSPKFPIWIYIVLLMVLVGIQFYFMNADSGNNIKYSTFLEYVEKGYVDEITIENGQYIYGRYNETAVKDGIVKPPAEAQDDWSLISSSQANRFTTTMLEGDEIRPLLDSNGVTYEVTIKEDWFSGIFIWLLLIGVAIAFWIFIFR